MRSLARECVFKYLFSRLFNPDDEGLFDVLIKELNNDDKNFAIQLKDCIINDEQKYLDTIDKLAIGYKLQRIHNVDKCALLIGMAEFDNFKQTPKAIIIDESVKLVAKFSTENSPNFTNGILATYTEDK